MSGLDWFVFSAACSTIIGLDLWLLVERRKAKRRRLAAQRVDPR